MASRRKTMAVKTAADFTTRTEMGTVEISVGGVLTAVEVTLADYVLTSTQMAGGVVELENDAIDWKPFHILTNHIVALTSTSTGGAQAKTKRFECHKKLPSNSTVTVYFTAGDAGNQSIALTLCWETDMAFKGKQTYSKSDVGTEITQITVDKDHNTVAIPAEKGGRVVAFEWIVHQTLETIVQGGGKVEIFNSSRNWQDFEYYTEGASCIGAGAVEVGVEVKPVDLPLPPRTDVTTDFTPWDNQSQALKFLVVWEGK